MVAILEFIAKYWQIGVGALLMAILAFGLHSCDVKRIDDMNKDALAKQVMQDQTQCDEQKKLTQEVSNDYEKKIAALNSRHAADISKLRVNNTCAIVAVPTSGYNASSGANGLSRNVGIQAWDIIDSAAACDKNTEQLMACQAFIKKALPQKK